MRHTEKSLSIHTKETHKQILPLKMLLLILVALFFSVNFCYPSDWHTTKVCPLKGPQKIPRLIHQIWFDFGRGLGGQPPLRYRRLSHRLRRLHPNWKYVLWSEDDVRLLIETKFPWFMPTWQSYDHVLKRHDVSRILIMAAVGGVYLDHDYAALLPLDGTEQAEGRDPLLNSSGGSGIPSLLGACSVVLESETGFPGAPGYTNNGFLAGIPGHHLWLRMLQRLARVPLQERSSGGTGNVLQVTGPQLLAQEVESQWRECSVAVTITCTRPSNLKAKKNQMTVNC